MSRKRSVRRGSETPSTDGPGARQKWGGTQFCDQLPCRSNGSINYTVRTDVRHFVSFNKGRTDVHLFVSLNKGRVEGH